jgi:hypothetical protein
VGPIASAIATAGLRVPSSDGLRGGAAPVRTYIPGLLDEVLKGRIDPGGVIDFEADLEESPRLPRLDRVAWRRPSPSPTYSASLDAERRTRLVSLGVPLGWPQRSGGFAREADALSTAATGVGLPR